MLVFFLGTLLLPAGPATASRDDLAAISAYARARAADSAGASGQAAKGYAAALAGAPGNQQLAARTLSQALAAGDHPLALRAARLLEGAGVLAPDGRLLLLSEALRTRDWKAAGRHIDKVQQDEVFAFMTPILRAWTAFGSRKGDALALLDSGKADPLSATYIAEHRALLLLAHGDESAGAAALLGITEGDGSRVHRLRIAGAALLARKGDRREALALLTGNAPPIVAARKLLDGRKPIPGEIASAPAGVAEFLVRLAIDLQRQDITSLALSFSRLATFLAPESSEAWLVTSDLLAALDRHNDAIAVLANISAADPFAGSAEDARIRLHVAAGDRASALARAEVAIRDPAAGVADWTRLGDLYGSLERYDAAAEAYAGAIARNKSDPAGRPEWALYLLYGSALERGGKWAEGKTALQNAYKLAPDQPVVLNYLGYAQLERRENLDESERLIREANRLQPDDMAITDSLGWAYYLRGKLPEAITMLERAAQGTPADPAIKEHLGDAYYRAGRRFEARYAWEAALLFADETDGKRLRAKIEAGLSPALAAP